MVPDRPGSGYTIGMKTAVSIPDELFERAEEIARREKKSRSQVFAEALRDYVARRYPDAVTEALDSALDGIEEGEDPFVGGAARRTLERSDWS